MIPIEIISEPLEGYCRYAPLAVQGYWLQQTGFLAPLWSEMRWWAKSCHHTPQANLETVLASILAGNRALYQINRVHSKIVHLVRRLVSAAALNGVRQASA